MRQTKGGHTELRDAVRHIRSRTTALWLCAAATYVVVYMRLSRLIF